MIIKTALVIISLLTITSFSKAQIIWGKSLEESKEIAKKSNKLILVDFWADWCKPCLEMDENVWSDRTIQKLTNKFVPLKYDLSSGFHNASPYTINAIPTIMILDGLGNIIYEITAIMDKADLKKMLDLFPAQVEAINVSLVKYNENKNDLQNTMTLAMAYQQKGSLLKGIAKQAFLFQSDQYLEKAKQYCNLNEYRDLVERIDIIKSINDIYYGREKKAIKNIEKIIEKDSFFKENKALAIYVLVLGNLQINNVKKAKEHFLALEKIDSGKVYYNLLQDRMKEI